MTDQPQRLKDVTILATESARLVYEHPMDIWEYKRLSDEEKALLYATIRGQMVHAATQQYPGHLFAFTEPVVEKPDGEFTIAEDKVIGKAVVIRCHAFVWAPQVVPRSPESDTTESLVGTAITATEETLGEVYLTLNDGRRIGCSDSHEFRVLQSGEPKHI